MAIFSNGTIARLTRGKCNSKLRTEYIGLLVLFLPNGYAMLMRPTLATEAVF